MLSGFSADKRKNKQLLTTRPGYRYAGRFTDLIRTFYNWIGAEEHGKNFRISICILKKRNWLVNIIIMGISGIE